MIATVVRPPRAPTLPAPTERFGVDSRPSRARCQIPKTQTLAVPSDGAFFTVWTIQRTRDFAILKTFGATTRYLLRDALGQAVVLLLGGTLYGTALAAGIGAPASGTVPFGLSASTVFVPVAVMIALGTGGAAPPVRRITSVDPMTALPVTDPHLVTTDSGEVRHRWHLHREQDPGRV